MKYKAYYTFKTTANKDVGDSLDWTINFDWVTIGAGAYRFDVRDAEGFKWVGKNVDCGGSFNFTCEVFDDDKDDYVEGEIDWETIDEDLEENRFEATFSLFNEFYEPVRYGEKKDDLCEFEIKIYDNEGKLHIGKTMFVEYGNL